MDDMTYVLAIVMLVIIATLAVLGLYGALVVLSGIVAGLGLIGLWLYRRLRQVVRAADPTHRAPFGW